MTEVFRKNYAYGETIPVINTHVSMSMDIFEEQDKYTQFGPYLKAVFNAAAGPMKSPPLIVEPLQENVSKILHLSQIPVPLPQENGVDLSLIFDVVNYRWTAAVDGKRDQGVITFDLRLRAAFTALGRSYTLQLDQRPCSITLSKKLVPSAMQYAALGVSGAGAPEGITQPGIPVGQAVSSETGTQQQYQQSNPNAERFASGTVEGVQSSEVLSNRLQFEEQLRELSARILSRS